MTQEEIIVRMGLDASEFAKKIRAAQRDLLQSNGQFQSAVGQMGQHAEKTFLHAGSAARQFHGLLEKIKETSPLVGSALQFALSPVVATIGVISAGIAFATNALKGFNASMDAAQAKAGLPVGSFDANLSSVV